MDRISSPKELMEHFTKMDKDNSICQVYIPSKGKFTIVLEEEAENTIGDDVKANPKLAKLIQDSISAYHKGKFITTSELLKSLSPEDFRK